MYPYCIHLSKYYQIEINSITYSLIAFTVFENQPKMYHLKFSVFIVNIAEIVSQNHKYSWDLTHA